MNLGEALGLIALILGNRSDLATKGQTALGIAQSHFEQGPDYPWFLVSESATIVTAIGERRIPMPTDFIGEYEEAALFYEDTDGELTKLAKKDYDYLVGKYTATAEGEPEMYSADGLYFNLFPLPDDLYTLQTKFYKKDTAISTLSSGSTNKWLTYAPNCLIGWAGQNLAAGLRDTVAAARFQVLEGEGRKLLNTQNEERKHSNRQYQIGGPHV
jgi:hypothetical protein